MSGSLLDAFLDEDTALLNSKREIHLAIRRDGKPNWDPAVDPILGDGSPGNPLDASTGVKLDTILNAVPYMQEDTRFVFGPGIFRTAGFPTWQPLAGQEFVGSGMDATILRLELPLSSLVPGTGHEPIHTDNPARGTGLRISDMTLDCNMGGQPVPNGWDYPPIGCGGVSLAGSDIELRRVRVINGGSRFPSPAGNEGVNVNFRNGGSVYNLKIEDCIIERPFRSNAREMPCIATQQAFYQNSVFRNNLMDCALVNPGPFIPVPIQNLTGNGTSGTLVTLRQHDLQPGDKVIITGTDSLNGIYSVTSKTDEWTAVLDGVPTGTSTIGAAEKFSKPSLLVSSLTWTNPIGSDPYATVVTAVPHNRVVDDYICIDGASPADYNGTFKVTWVSTDGLSLRCNLLTNPGTSPATGEIWLDKVFVSWRMRFTGYGAPTTGIRAIMADGGRGTVVEGNRVFNCDWGLYYDETYSPLSPDVISKTTDLIIRDNYFYSVLYGIYVKRANTGVLNPIGRIIALENQFEMENTSGAIGMQFDVANDTLTPSAGYSTLIVRGNRIRPADGTLPNNISNGIIAKSVTALTIDNNWVNAPSADAALQRGSAGGIQTFNNRTLEGTLLPVTILGTSTEHQGELTTDAELMYATL